jgi:hypothetical protein
VDGVLVLVGDDDVDDDEPGVGLEGLDGGLRVAGLGGSEQSRGREDEQQEQSTRHEDS